MRQHEAEARVGVFGKQPQPAFQRAMRHQLEPVGSYALSHLPRARKASSRFPPLGDVQRARFDRLAPVSRVLEGVKARASSP